MLRLSDDQLYFIVSDENSGPAPPILWCEIPQAMFFSEYLIVGLDDDHKDIFLGVSSSKEHNTNCQFHRGVSVLGFSLIILFMIHCLGTLRSSSHLNIAKALLD